MTSDNDFRNIVINILTLLFDLKKEDTFQCNNVLKVLLGLPFYFLWAVVCYVNLLSHDRDLRVRCDVIEPEWNYLNSTNVCICINDKHMIVYRLFL